jgi:hypothetical protein
MQIFPRQLNYLPLVAALGLAVGGGVVTFVFVYYFSPRNLQVGYAPVQPVPYSHRLHAGQLGIDCRYCHANVERSFEAMVPPTQTCMGCHTLVRPDSAALEPVRESWRTGDPVQWVRVHKVPDHVYFDHSIHLSAGVGCVTCHGRIDRMEVVTQQEPLSMGWCLDCHRDPEPNLRPHDQITNMAWERPEDAQVFVAADVESDRVHPTENDIVIPRDVLPPEHCSGCHR